MGAAWLVSLEGKGLSAGPEEGGTRRWGPDPHLSRAGPAWGSLLHWPPGSPRGGGWELGHGGV